MPPYFENFGKRIIKSSKLYFSDVGLASYLLGIQDSMQLERHPLRGELFENLAILEFIKSRVNTGVEPRVFYYRDSGQNEVDLVAPQGTDLLAIEIKSSQTFNKNFLKPLKKFTQLACNRNVKPYVVYAGSQRQIVDGIEVINYEDTIF